MLAKKIQMTDAERAKRIRQDTREIAMDYDLAAFQRAFERIIPSKIDVLHSRANGRVADYCHAMSQRGVSDDPGNFLDSDRGIHADNELR
jgi:hypothetical protein